MEFINKQNKSLESLLNEKINTGIFNSKSKNRISVQRIKKSEIFIDKTFTNAIFNSSYRKYINTQKHENYNEYEIRMEQIESEMTDSILKDKKLLNYEIMGFNFDNEVFTYEIGDLISTFAYEKMPLNDDDKAMIFNYINEKLAGSTDKCKDIINGFITLIKYLNRESKDKNDKINGNTKICDIDIVKNLKNIKKSEIFTSENIDETFTNAIYNSSYRKFINTQKPENYNGYEIKMEQIESEMTDSL
jgi:hypothetical protein